jgi:hypothetical protein
VAAHGVKCWMQVASQLPLEAARLPAPVGPLQQVPGFLSLPSLQAGVLQAPDALPVASPAAVVEELRQEDHLAARVPPQAPKPEVSRAELLAPPELAHFRTPLQVRPQMWIHRFHYHLPR